MKQLSFKILSMLAILLSCFSNNTYGNSTKNRLIPSHTKVQLAGGIGTVSAGIGWTYGKKEQFESDLMIGYIPKYSSDKARATFTLKQTFLPWQIALSSSGWMAKLSFTPLRTGLYANATFGKHFWTFEPDTYPDKYYKFSTGWRFHLFIGEDLTFRFNSKQALSLYYEVHSYDLMAISAFNNKELNFWDFIKLSVGIKYKFR